MAFWQVIVGVLVLAFLLYVLRYHVREVRQINRLLDAVSEPLNLCREDATSAPFAIDTVKIARGKRRGVEVRVQFTPNVGENQKASTTTVTLDGPVSLSDGVTLDRIEEQDDLIWPFSKLQKTETLLPGATAPNTRAWFGPSQRHGGAAEIERVFNPRVRALLDRLPRKLAVVSLHGNRLAIHWFGLEEDPAVVGLAFDIGIDILAELTPAGSPRR